jgi:hypothetical protein
VAILLLLVFSSVGVALLTHSNGSGTGVSGQVTFFDSQNRLPWTTNSLSIALQGLNIPPAGYHYDAWLVNNDSEQVFALGTMSENNQNASLHFVGSGSDSAVPVNLLASSDKFEITLEQGTPKQPTGTVVFSGTFPVKSFVHVMHLLVAFPVTPNHIALLVGLLSQTRALNMQTNFLEEAAVNKDPTQVRCIAQNMLDIIEGAHGTHYQPVDSLCPAQLTVAGDGYGLLGSGFLAASAAHATFATSQPDATRAMHQHAALLDVALSNVKTWVTTLDQEALHLLNTPTDLSQVEGMVQLADNAYHGVDSNGDGQIDPVTGEAGALTAFQQGQLMASLTLTHSS